MALRQFTSSDTSQIWRLLNEVGDYIRDKVEGPVKRGKVTWPAGKSQITVTFTTPFPAGTTTGVVITVAGATGYAGGVHRVFNEDPNGFSVLRGDGSTAAESYSISWEAFTC